MSGRFDLSGSGSVRLVENADDVFDSFAYAGEQLCPIEVVDICWPVRLELSEGGEDQLSFGDGELNRNSIRRVVSHTAQCTCLEHPTLGLSVRIPTCFVFRQVICDRFTPADGRHPRNDLDPLMFRVEVFRTLPCLRRRADRSAQAPNRHHEGSML